VADRVRVLVVDDAVVIRRLVGDLIEADPELELVGVAANGRIALQRITQLRPDVVTLDVEMPELDGIATLRELRRDHPTLPVIMFSTLTERGASATLDALALGASDYVTKPANVGGVTEALERVRQELIPKIKGLCARRTVPVSPSAAPLTPMRAPRPRLAVAGGPVDAVVVASSTGGPNALTEVVGSLPGDLPVPVLVVQHMPPVFTRLLAERLDHVSALRVVEAGAGDAVVPGTVYLAPGDHHLTVRRRPGLGVVTALDQGAPESSCRPAADPLFRSAAEVWGGDVLAVVLTGMGSDGCRGADVLRGRGARVIAQDQETSVVWGMPGAVAEAGLADAVVGLPEIAAAITDVVLASRLAGAPA